MRSLLETPPSSLSSFNRLHRRSRNILRSCTCHTEAKDGPGKVQVSGVRPWPILGYNQSIHLLVSISSFCLAFLLSYDRHLLCHILPSARRKHSEFITICRRHISAKLWEGSISMLPSGMILEVLNGGRQKKFENPISAVLASQTNVLIRS